jgi:excisionase family DNA binding protein
MNQSVRSRRDATPEEAAAVLGVSSEHVLRVVAAGELCGRSTESDIRIPQADLQHHARLLREQREAALDEMVADARQLGLKY